MHEAAARRGNRWVLMRILTFERGSVHGAQPFERGSVQTLLLCRLVLMAR